MRVFLTGFMGAGKSTVGRLLAARLECEFIDLDEAIERSERRPLAEIFEASGEEEFRRLEREELARTVGRERCVVATGGGTPVSAEARSWMRGHGVIVWLDVPFESLRTRVVDGSDRPLWRNAENARRLLAGRLDAYRDCDLAIAAGESSAADLALAIAKRLLGAGLR